MTTTHRGTAMDEVQQMTMPLEPEPEVKLNVWEQHDREQGYSPPPVAERVYVPLDRRPPATASEPAALLRRLERLREEETVVRDRLRHMGVAVPAQRTRIKQATNERLDPLRDYLALHAAGVGPKDAAPVLGVSADYAYDLLAALRETGEVERVRPGVYRLTEPGWARRRERAAAARMEAQA